MENGSYVNPSVCFFSRCLRRLLKGSVVAGDWGCGSALESAAARGVSAGTGVGGAILSGGKILQGHGGIAGHIGHFTVDPVGADNVPNLAQLLPRSQRGLDLRPDPCNPARAGCRLNTGQRTKIDQFGFRSLP